MKHLGIAAVAALGVVAMLNMPVTAQCVATGAPDGDLSINMLGLMCEERELGTASGTPDQTRGVGVGYAEASPVSPPPPGWGLLFGEGTWCYEDTNGNGQLEAGGFGIIPETPGCGTIPCLTFNEQVDDETCGAGPDRLIFGANLHEN